MLVGALCVLIIVVAVLTRGPRKGGGVRPPFDREQVVQLLREDGAISKACQFREREGGVGTVVGVPGSMAMRMEIRRNETTLCATILWSEDIRDDDLCYDDAADLVERLERTCLLYWQTITGIYKLPY